MKKFNSSDFAHKRTEIFKAAKADGAILQKKNTNGVVLEEFVLSTAKDYVRFKSEVCWDPSSEFQLDY